MEDCNAYIADCVVISCCCECLILQVVVFLMLELPQRVARKTREYALKKLRQRRKGRRGWKKDLVQACGHESRRGDHVGLDDGRPTTRSSREVEGIMMNVDEWQCMEEVEKVLEELSMKGEFAFGSFWGRRENNNNVERGKVCMYCTQCCVMHPQELVCGGHIVNFQLIEVVGLG